MRYFLVCFILGIKNKTALITESYYEVDPQTEEALKKTEETKDLNVKNKLSTNQASNEDEAFKEMMRNFKTIHDTPTNQEDTEATIDLENVSLKTLQKQQQQHHHILINSKQYALARERP